MLMPHGGFGAVTHECFANHDLNQLLQWCRPLPLAQGDRRFSVKENLTPDISMAQRHCRLCGDVKGRR